MTVHGELPPDVAAVVEPLLGHSPTSARVLQGGLTSTVWWCETASGQPVVVKQLAELHDAGALWEGEILAMNAIDRPDVPAVVGHNDVTRIIVMTALPGDRLATATDLRPRLGALAAWMTELHAGPTPALQPWRRWGPDAARRPAQTSRPELWDQFAAAYAAIDAPPWNEPAHTCLLHRDLHPLNVLWDNNEIAAVVDWANACIGHPYADLAHLRWNLAVLVDQEAADDVVELYRQHGGLGESYDPRWDLQEVNSLGDSGPELAIGTQAWHDAGRRDLTKALVLERTEAFLAAALDRL